MLTVGDAFPEYDLTACVSLDPQQAFARIDHKTYEGSWRAVFFYPRDFTFVCPTELAAFARMHDDFAERDTQLLGVSGDSEYVHHAWRRAHEELHELPFPLLADTRHELMSACGVRDEDGVAQRAVFLVDPSNVVRFAMVTDGSVGRNPDEVLRVLDALQTGALCPCNWTRGEATLDPATLLTSA